MNTYRVLAALLSYPEEGMASSLHEMKGVLEQEGLLAAADRQGLAPLFADLAQMDIYDLQARYVELFDQSRSLSLHLFEHVHGESLDRGQAMVDLLQRYRERGLELSAGELPDFLPVFLEYLSQLPAEEAAAELGEARAVIAVLARRLGKRETPYAAVLDAVAVLAAAGAAAAGPADTATAEAAASAEAAATAEAAVEETPESEPRESLDAEWQEQPVDFSKREKGFVGRQRARVMGPARKGET